MRTSVTRTVTKQILKDAHQIVAYSACTFPVSEIEKLASRYQLDPGTVRDVLVQNAVSCEPIAKPAPVRVRYETLAPAVRDDLARCSLILESAFGDAKPRQVDSESEWVIMKRADVVNLKNKLDRAAKLVKKALRG